MYRELPESCPIFRPTFDLNLDIRRFMRKNASELIVLLALAGGFYRPNALICDGA
jgi:hypothetical protein